MSRIPFWLNENPTPLQRNRDQSCVQGLVNAWAYFVIALVKQFRIAHSLIRYSVVKQPDRTQLTTTYYFLFSPCSLTFCSHLVRVLYHILSSLSTLFLKFFKDRWNVWDSNPSPLRLSASTLYSTHRSCHPNFPFPNHKFVTRIKGPD